MFCFAKQKLLITSDNALYPATASRKPPLKFCSASLCRTSDIAIRYTPLLNFFNTASMKKSPEQISQTPNPKNAKRLIFEQPPNYPLQFRIPCLSVPNPLIFRHE